MSKQCRILIVRGGPDALGKSPVDDIPARIAASIHRAGSPDFILAGLVTKRDVGIPALGMKVISPPFSDEVPLTRILNECRTSSYPAFGNVGEYLEYYSVYDRIMDRMLKIRAFTAEERRTIYWWLVHYSETVIAESKPTHILFPVIPHFAFDYVFYVAAIVHGIQTLAFENVFSSSMIWLVDIEKRLNGCCFNDVLTPEKVTNEGKVFICDYINRRSKEYVLPSYEIEHKRKSKVTLRHYLALGYYALLQTRPLLRLKRKSNTVENFRSYDSLKLRIEFFKSGKQYRAYEDFSLKSVPDFEYILFALHDEPERVLVPMCSPYDDQVALAVLLAKKLKPRGIKLVIREHPAMFNAYRSKLRRDKSLYRVLAETDNIFLSSTTMDSRIWVMNSLGVVTGTGTIGLEAVILNKPVLAFGHPWYGGYPLVFSMSGVENFIQLCSSENGRKSIASSKTITEHLEQIVSRTRCAINEPCPNYSALSDDERCKNAAVLAEIVINCLRQN